MMAQCMVKQGNFEMAKQYNGEMKNGYVMPQQMAQRQNGTMVKQYNGEMVKWFYNSTTNGEAIYQ